MHKKIKEIEDLKKMLNNFSKIYFLRKESEQFLNNVE